MYNQYDWSKLLHDCKNLIGRRIASFPISNQSNHDLGIGAGGDPLKEVDLLAENAVVETLKQHGLSFTMISEESGTLKFGKHPDECFITVDPIDGSTNLARGIPFYATSIAVSNQPKLREVNAALVTDLFHDVTYTAQKQKGAYRNGTRIAPSKRRVLEDAVVGIDLDSFRIQKLAPRLTRLLGQIKHMRHFGANALEMCYVADGSTDAFVDIRGKLRITDMAAAWLIVKESGAEICTLDGKDLDADLDLAQNVEFVAAANRKLLETVLAFIEP